MPNGEPHTHGHWSSPPSYGCFQRKAGLYKFPVISEYAAMVKAGQGAPLALLTSDASTEQGIQVAASQELIDLLGLGRVVTLSTCYKVSL